MGARSLLQDWLKEHPDVNIVISSSWREILNLQDLKVIFSPELRNRIIDKCPVTQDYEEAEFYRYVEILSWVNKTKYQGPWFALDDKANQFPPNFAKLVLCDSQTGIDENIIKNMNEIYCLMKKSNFDILI